MVQVNFLTTLLWSVLALYAAYRTLREMYRAARYFLDMVIVAVFACAIYFVVELLKQNDFDATRVYTWAVTNVALALYQQWGATNLTGSLCQHCTSCCAQIRNIAAWLQQ